MFVGCPCTLFVFLTEPLNESSLTPIGKVKACFVEMHDACKDGLLHAKNANVVPKSTKLKDLAEDKFHCNKMVF